MQIPLTLLSFLFLLTTSSIILPQSSTQSSLSSIFRVGGFTQIVAPSGVMYQQGLRLFLDGNGEVRERDIIKVEEQVVSGINFRFTFRDGKGEIREQVVYVPLGAKGRGKGKGGDSTIAAEATAGDNKDVESIKVGNELQNSVTVSRAHKNDQLTRL